MSQMAADLSNQLGRTHGLAHSVLRASVLHLRLEHGMSLRLIGERHGSTVTKVRELLEEGQ